MNVLIPLTMGVMALGPSIALIAGLARRGWLRKAFACVVVVIGAVWWVDVWLLFATDELGGWFDCYPYCSRSQTAAGAALVYLPVLMAALLLGAAVAHAVRSVRRREVMGP